MIPSWLQQVLILALNLALPWLQGHASATIVAIVNEIIAFLEAQQKAGVSSEQAALDLLAHVKKVTSPAP